MRKCLLLLLLVVMLPCRGTPSGGPGYHLWQYTDENGLPQNTVQDLAFGNYGFVWIATEGGLARFDGQKMRVFTKKELSVNSDRYVAVGFETLIGTDRLTAITEHRQLVTIDGGTAYGDPQTNVLRTAALRRIQSQLRSENISLDTVRSRDNFLKYKLIVADKEHYYLYTDEKVAFFEHGKLAGHIPFAGTPYFKPFPSAAHVREDVISKTKALISADNFMSISGKLFYHQGSEGPLLLKLSIDGTIPLTLTGDIERDPGFAVRKDHIRIITNRFKGQAFACLNQNIYHILFNEQSGRLETKLLLTNLDIEEKHIHRMLYDEGNGTLFLGSVSQGLFIARPYLFHVVGTGKGNPFNSFFYAQVPFSDSSVLTSDGLVVSRRDIRQVNGDFLRTRGEESRFSLVRGSDGHFWGVERHGFFRFGNGKHSTWTTGNLQPERLFEGSDGRLWIGFLSGELACLPKGADVSQQPNVVTKVNAKCSFLYEDRPGRVWIGTSSGMFLFDSIKKATYPVKGLEGKNIRSIFHTGPDELWITTYGDGFFLLKDNRLYKMPLDDKNYLAYAHCILEDDQSFFWISANKGLFRAAKQDLLNYAAGKRRNVLYLYHNKTDGFLTNEFNGGCQPCGLKLRNGYFSFPSMNGLVWFKPGDIPLPNLAAPIRFEEFELDEKPIAARDTLLLSYNYNHLSFRVVTAFMGNVDDVEFFYSLRKSASDTLKWYRARNGQQIDFYRMPAGVYTFVMHQPTGFGGRFIERRLVLNVQRAWFLSWWFIAALVLVIAAGVRQITRWRVRNLVRQNAILVGKVNERTIDLSRALEELKASDEALQTQLQIQMRIIGAINHDLHTPLRSLSQYVPRFLEQIAVQPNDPQTIRLGESIGKSTLKVFHLADELLMFIKATYNKKGRISYEPLPLCELLHKKEHFFTEMAQDNEVTFEVDCDPELMITTNRIMAEILFHNLIDNALKHTYGRVVRVSAVAEANDVKVTVTDSGFGMDREIVEWLNYRAAETKTDMPGAPQTPSNLGLGLVMVREIAMLLGIRLNVVSNEEGTAIMCVFGE